MYLLATAAVVCLLALSPAVASATNSVQVFDESTGTACSNLGAGHNTGGCPLHVEGIIEIRVDLGIFGEVHEAECGVEWDIRIGGNGTMAISDQELYNGDSNCTGSTPVVTECDLPWEGTTERDSTTGTTHTYGATSQICLNPSESSTDAIGTLGYDVVETEGTECLRITIVSKSLPPIEISLDVEIEADGVIGKLIHILS